MERKKVDIQKKVRRTEPIRKLGDNDAGKKKSLGDDPTKKIPN